MIYRVVLDDTIDLHTSDINCMLLNPSLDLEMNSAGSFNFTLPPSHPYWDSIKVLKSTIDVYEDGDLIFTGRIASIEKNWNNERVVQCEGALAYFNDSVHRQMKWETPLPIASEDPTVHNFLKDILDNHNVFEGAENVNRHIFIGNITVDPEVVTREVNYDTTLDILTRMCIDTNGGYMSVRKDLEDGKLYLDWVKDFTEESGQPAQFGLNLLNFDTSLAAEDICTGVLARGAEVNEQTVMLNDVELVDETTYPDMSVTHYTTQYQDILWHREGVEKFGQVVQVHDFSDAQTAWKDGQGQIVANSLFEMAKKWLEEKNTKIETIEVEVAELAWLGEGMPKYKLGQIVELSDNIHMAGESYETRLLPMYKLSCDLNSGSKKVTLGTPPKKELTQISASNSDSSTLSSSGSSSGSGGSGEGEECRVHDVKVDGTSVVTNKVANIDLTGKADVSTVNSLANTVAGKADTSTVNALANVVSGKQDQIEFNTLEAATEVLTRLKADNKVYNLGGGTEVEANPSETATDDLNTIKIGDTVYDIPGGLDDLTFISDPMIFSEEEQVVGSWIDGKPVYQKTFLNIALHAGYDNVFTHNLGIEKYIDFSGRCCVNGDGWSSAKPLPYYQINWGGYVDVLGWNANTITFNSKWNSSYADITIQYTKVADSPLSGPKKGKIVQRSDIYSEEERLVGRWTDGKPLYQKTVVINNPVSTGATTSIAHGISNVETIVDIYGGAYLDSVIIDVNSFASSNYYTLVYASQTNISYELKWGSSTFTKIRATIQYTKSTDAPFSKQLIEDPQFVMMSDIYSEDEQIVGRWTDGKPLYQKTITLTGSYTGSMNNIDAGMTNVNFEFIKFDAHGLTSTGTIIHLPNVNNNATGDNGGIMFNTTNKLFAFRLGNLTYSKIHITFQYTKTTDTPGTGPTPGNLIYLPALYSEEEREVGVWTDGKPIYQKNIPIPTIQSAQSGVILSNLGLNIDNCVDIKVRLYKDTAPDNDSIIATASFGDMYFYYRKSEDSIRMDAPFSWVVGRYGNLTIQYTKTTDQPGSGRYLPDGQLAHHYSTSEKVVGTWIDGSTIYERTWDFGSNIQIPSNTWYNTSIDSTNMSRLTDVIGYAAEGAKWAISGGCDGNVVELIQFRNNNIAVRYLTLQYTKSL